MVRQFSRLCLSVLLGWWVGGSTPAVLASCAGLAAPIGQAIGSAPVVFVGTITGTSDGDRTATVHVDEVWRGPVLPAEVTLHGSPDVSAAATSVDRRYERGKQYLFIPENGRGSDFDDNSCSGTRAFSSDLQAYRPAGARRYPPAPPGPPLIPIAAGAAVLVAAAVALVVLRGKRKGRSSPGLGG